MDLMKILSTLIITKKNKMLPQERIIEIELKAFREKMAREQRIEPYKILTNDTIDNLSRSKPRSTLELLNVKGIGPAKSRHYGATIVGIINKALSEVSTSNSIQAQEKTDEPSPKERIFEVAEFLDHFNSSFARKPLAIHGEIFDSLQRRGSNIYFKIKDRKEEAVISCYMRSHVEDRLGIILEEGTEVIISGFLGVYKPSGQFSLTVTEFMVHGEGLLKRSFEQLQEKLKEEGLFAIDRKRTLPRFISRIGLITAQGSDAEKDFITHVIPRNISIYRHDVRVEGLRSAELVTQALRYFNEAGENVDVIVVTRGGGSLDSLQSFNSEQVARAVSASKIPVISAIGHENDITITDLVADVRASTPTHAGKIVSQGWQDAETHLTTLQKSLYISTNDLCVTIKNKNDTYSMLISHGFTKMVSLSHALLEKSLRNVSRHAHIIFEKATQLRHLFIRSGHYLDQQIQNIERKVAEYHSRAEYITQSILEKSHMTLNSSETTLEALNPEKILKRGFSVIKANDTIITSVNSLDTGMKVKITLKDGTRDALIQKK
jgi:exodeoxyribonuclease VII large subunit